MLLRLLECILEFRSGRTPESTMKYCVLSRLLGLHPGSLIYVGFQSDVLLVAGPSVHLHTVSVTRRCMILHRRSYQRDCI